MAGSISFASVLPIPPLHHLHWRPCYQYVRLGISTRNDIELIGHIHMSVPHSQRPTFDLLLFNPLTHLPCSDFDYSGNRDPSIGTLGNITGLRYLNTLYAKASRKLLFSWSTQLNLCYPVDSFSHILESIGIRRMILWASTIRTSKNLILQRLFSTCSG